MKEFLTMTQDEVNKINWDVERRRFLKTFRKARPMNLSDIVVDLIAVFLMVTVIILVCCRVCSIVRQSRETEERTAYIQGRFGVDRVTASAAAKNGVGYCAEQYLAERGW